MYDLEEMCQQLKPVIKPGTALVTLQNGVEAPGIVAKYFGVENAVGATIVTSARIESPGLIVHEGANLKVVMDERNLIACEFAAIANKSGISCELSSDMEASLWKKIIRLASVSGITCLTRKPFGWTNRNPEALAFLRSLIEEAYQVALARGVRLPETTVQDSFDGLASHGFDNFKPSMLVDLERGKRLEVNYLSGAVSRLGKEKSIPTPCSDAVVVALGPYENPS
jgi:2-dehydropantoate 2-reductase